METCQQELMSLYQVLWTIPTHKINFTLTELENMIPFEYSIYLAMTNAYITAENERLKKLADK